MIHILLCSPINTVLQRIYSFIHVKRGLKRLIYLRVVQTQASFIKGSPDPSLYILEINVGKSRIRHRMTLKLNF